MKKFQNVRGVWLRCVLVVLLAAASEGCRRRAKPAPAAAANQGSATESEVVVAAETPGGLRPVNLPPAAPITNNVAPPPRVDKATGKLILQTDGVILKKKTQTE